MKADAYAFYKKIEQYIRENAMLTWGDGVVAGVSGGADSVCLLRILCALRKEYGLRLVVLHVHHGIRGADADADEAFVREECGRLKVLFEAVHADIPALAAEWGCSQEEAGRRVRYGEFCRAAAAHGYQKIAVAHNANDNAETFLFQAFRGSGLWGLAGIAPCRAEGDFMVIRPLLDADRAQIEAYLAAEGAEYRTDATNFTSDYARNRIRNEILPLARSVNEGAVGHLAETAAELYGLSKFLRELTLEGYRKVAREDGASADMQEGAQGNQPMGISLDIRQWEALPAFLQKEVVLYALGRVAGSRRDIGRVHVQAVCGLMRGAVGKRVRLPHGLCAARTYKAVKIEPESMADNAGLAGQETDAGEHAGQEEHGGKPMGQEERFGRDTGQWERTGKHSEPARRSLPSPPDLPQLAAGDNAELTSFPVKLPLGVYELTLKLLEEGNAEFAHISSVFCNNKDRQEEEPANNPPAPLPASPCGPVPEAQGNQNEKNSLNPKNCYTKCFDYAKIRNTLVLRTRQAGDYVVIRSDGSRKSLKSLLIDKKVPREYRDGLPLLTVGSCVLWAVGVRGGEGFYVTGNTKQILVAELRRKDRNCNGRED